MRINKKYKWNDGPWLILKGSPDNSITICWITSIKKNSYLFWGNSESKLDKNIISTGKKFHSVTIDNLLSDTQYFYIINEDLPLYPEGTVFSFQTAKDDTSDIDLEFIIAGDLQPKNDYTLETNYNLALQINKENPDFIVQMGDLVQIGSLVKYWHYLMKSLAVMASNRAILPVVGNHEYYLFHKNKNFRSFFPYNFLKRKSAYYSKNIGKLHLVFLDPYDGGFAGMGSKLSYEQKEWFVQDLEKAVSNGSEWIFVNLHQAVLSNGEYSGDIKLQEWLLPLLSKYDVDAVFWGHAHIYEHWQYHYGSNGYVLNLNDTPGENPIDFFCIGSSGASLESNFNLFTHKPFKRKKLKWFNEKTGIKESKTTIQYPWNKDIFFEGRMGIDQFCKNDSHYYHYPFDKKGNYLEDPKNSYNTENKWFGYLYGENTLHYVKVKIKSDTCIISIHYADGTLISGPDGSIPQQFYLEKKNRSIH